MTSVQQGWIKLYKQTLDSDFWIDPEPFSHRDAFFHVLLSANWRPGVSHRRGRKVTIERGQFLTSTRKLAETFHWSRNRVYRWIRIMKNYQMIESKDLGFGTLLTVVNYDKYQIGPTTHEATNGATDGTTNEAIRETDHEAADGATDGARSKNIDIRTEKEEKANHADAWTPSAEVKVEPPRGSPEWYKLHYDD